MRLGDYIGVLSFGYDTTSKRITPATTEFLRMSQEARVTPPEGYRYQPDLSSIDNIYNIELKQINSTTGKASDIQLAGLTGCNN